jgi:tetratricopeptide (TPR) repeat protein
VRMVVAADQGPLLPCEKHEAWVVAHCVAHGAPTQFQQIDEAFPEIHACLGRLLEQGKRQDDKVQVDKVQVDKVQGLSALLSTLFVHLLHRGKYGTAIEFIEALLALTNDDWEKMTWLGNLGVVYQTIGDPTRAITLHTQALEVSRQLGAFEARRVATAISGSVTRCWATVP